MNIIFIGNFILTKESTHVHGHLEEAGGRGADLLLHKSAVGTVSSTGSAYFFSISIVNQPSIKKYLFSVELLIFFYLNKKNSVF